MFTNFLNNVEKSNALPYSQIPGPPSYPLIGNVLGYQCPETGRLNKIKYEDTHIKFFQMQEPLPKSQDLVPPELRVRRPGEARHPGAGPHCPRV